MPGLIAVGSYKTLMLHAKKKISDTWRDKVESLIDKKAAIVC